MAETAGVSQPSGEGWPAAGGRPVAPPLVPLPRPPEVPLSFAQERLWVLTRLDPEAFVSNLQLTLPLPGPLAPRFLSAALTLLAARHEILRTRFPAAEGRCRQEISPPATVALPMVDLEGLPEPGREEAARRLRSSEVRRPFDVAREPLLRCILLRLGRERHQVLCILHPLTADRRSLDLLAGEMAELYDAAAAGNTAGQPCPPVQYADFALWQRQALTGQALDGQLAFWRDHLAGAPPVLSLPADRPRHAGYERRTMAAPLCLAPATRAAVAELGRRAGATPFMVLLAAFQVLLGRLAGEEDVVVGTPAEGRALPEVQRLIGPFTDLLPLRGDLAGDPVVSGLLDQVRRTLLAARRHQELPFILLVAALRPQREPGLTPLCQALFTLEDPPAGTLKLGRLAINPARAPEGVAGFDLALDLRQEEGGLSGVLQGRADLFDPVTVQRWAGHWTHLVAELAGNGGRRVSELGLLDLAERHQLLREWGLAPAAMTSPSRLHDLIAAAAARDPEATAVETVEEIEDGVELRRLTYAGLLRAGRSWASRLRAAGVVRGVPVAVCLERSAEMVVALLAALEAGGVYVPLDPALPPERLAGLLAEAGVGVVIAGRRFAAALGPEGGAGSPVRLLLDRDLPAVWDRPEQPEEPEEPEEPENNGETPGPEDLAYLIFTSGSTGRPKAVAVAHGPAARHFSAVAGRLGLEPGDRFALYSSPGFDTAVEEILATLTAGATLVVCGAERWSPGELLARAAGLRLSVLSLPTAIWQQWVQEMADGRAPAPPGLALRLVLVGGEAVPSEAARTWLAGDLAGRRGVRLLNGYGPTEAIASATWREVDASAAAVPGALPVGFPLPGLAAYVLGRGLVPTGVAGELCLGGDALAVGYLGQSAQTAERFAPDPFSVTPGARLYRTGDLVRRLPDGDLHFLGRTDRQLKIRGFRVEPGEVEAALAAHPQVRESAVVLREDGPGGRGLAAYVVPRPGTSPSPAELRAALAARLATHLVPAAVVLLDVLPLTPRGKLDRQALPSPRGTDTPAAGAPRPPRDRLELRLLRIWEQTLGGQLGVEDDFFERGGHSLLAVRLMARVSADFGCDLPLSLLFLARTVERLALELRSRSGQGGTAAARLVALTDGRRGAPLFCVHPLGGGALGYLELARQLAPRPVYGLEAPGLAAGEQPQRGLQEMAAGALEQIAAVQPGGPYRLAGWSFGALLAFEMARQLAERGEAVALLALVEPAPPAPGGSGAAPGEAALLALLLRDLDRRAGAAGPDRSVAQWGRDLDRLPAEQRIGEVLRRALAAGVLPPDSDAGLVRRLMQVYAAHLEAARAYAPGPYRGRIDLWQAAAAPAYGLRVWERLAAGSLALRTLPVDERDEPDLRELGRGLRERLAEIDEIDGRVRPGAGRPCGPGASAP